MTSTVAPTDSTDVGLTNWFGNSYFPNDMELDEGDKAENKMDFNQRGYWYIPTSYNNDVIKAKKIFWNSYKKETIDDLESSLKEKYFSTDDDTESLLPPFDFNEYGEGDIASLDGDQLKDEFIRIYTPKKVYSSNVGLNHLRNMSVPWYFDKIHDFRNTVRYSDEKSWFKFRKNRKKDNTSKIERDLNSRSLIACICSAFSKPLEQYREVLNFKEFMVKIMFFSVYERYLKPFYENPYYRILDKDTTVKVDATEPEYQQIPIVVKDGEAFKNEGEWGGKVHAAEVFKKKMQKGIFGIEGDFGTAGYKTGKVIHLQCDNNPKKNWPNDYPKTQEKGGKYYYDHGVKQEYPKPYTKEQYQNPEMIVQAVVDNITPQAELIHETGKKYQKGTWRNIGNRTDAASASTVSGPSTYNMLNPKKDYPVSYIFPFIINEVVGKNATEAEQAFEAETDKVDYIKKNSGKLFQENPIAYYLRIDKKLIDGPVKANYEPEDYELKFTFVQPCNNENKTDVGVDTSEWIPIRANTGEEIGWT